MSDVPAFIKDDQKEESNYDLSNLEPLIEQFKIQKAEVDRLETLLAIANEAFKKTAREEIPEIMNYLGYSELKLKTQEKLRVKEDASVSVPDDKESAFFTFLAERGDQDIIKLHFAFPRMSTEKRQLLMDLLDANEFDFEFKEGVHPQTLKSYFKKLLGIGEEDREEGIREGKYVHPDVVRDFTSIFVYYTTSITAPKGKELL